MKNYIFVLIGILFIFSPSLKAATSCAKTFTTGFSQKYSKNDLSPEALSSLIGARVNVQSEWPGHGIIKASGVVQGTWLTKDQRPSVLLRLRQDNGKLMIYEHTVRENGLEDIFNVEMTEKSGLNEFAQKANDEGLTVRFSKFFEPATQLGEDLKNADIEAPIKIFYLGKGKNKKIAAKETTAFIARLPSTADVLASMDSSKGLTYTFLVDGETVEIPFADLIALAYQSKN